MYIENEPGYIGSLADILLKIPSQSSHLIQPLFCPLYQYAKCIILSISL